MSDDSDDKHPASGGGPYEIPDVAGETAEIADDIDFRRAQADFDKEKN